jgi:hypothetical protein
MFGVSEGAPDIGLKNVELEIESAGPAEICLKNEELELESSVVDVEEEPLANNDAPTLFVGNAAKYPFVFGKDV